MSRHGLISHFRTTKANAIKKKVNFAQRTKLKNYLIGN